MNNNFHHNNNQQQTKSELRVRASFSLIELIVLVSVVALAFVGVMGILNRTLQLEGMLKGNLVARALASEGVELVAAIRDRNEAVGSEFNRYIAGMSVTPTILTNVTDLMQSRVDKMYVQSYDPASSEGTSWIDTNPPLDFTDNFYRLYFDPTNYYTHNSAGTATDYYRIIIANKTDTYLDVDSLVIWKHRGKTFYYIAERRLYDKP